MNTKNRLHERRQRLSRLPRGLDGLDALVELPAAASERCCGLSVRAANSLALREWAVVAVQPH
jgi:hypothetical protein